MTQDTSRQPNPSQGRRMLLLLAAFFALPVVLVLAMYQLDWRPGSGSSHGELLAPPQPLQLADLHDVQGRPFAAAQWKDTWHLVYVAGTACAAECQAQARQLRQVHVSLNKGIGRVQRVLLVAAEAPDTDLAALQGLYPDLVVIAGAGATALAEQFAPSSQANVAHVYLVDPLGNLMMRYPDGYAPNGLRRDLERLLRYSWAG